MNIQNLDNLEAELPQEFDGLPVFIVGGAVRDTIRGDEASDLDLMVTEVSPEEMESRGFKHIDSPNNDTFGVFQDSLGREVAIAREEVSTGPGHTDFDVRPVPENILSRKAVKRDLKRRDFTINAMALDARHHVLHDPHNGIEDLLHGSLRHVSKAFTDDPLRVLRGARFAARLDFEIAEETKRVMREVAPKLPELPGDRLRMELEKNFKEAESPRKFFDVLLEVDALEHSFPEVAALVDVPAGPDEHHQEGDAFEHTMLVLEEMNERRENDELALLMALSHDLGKAATPSDELPNHPGHGKEGVPIIENMAKRLSMSNEERDACMEAASKHMALWDIENLNISTVINLWEDMRVHHRMFDLMNADGAGRDPEKEWNEGEALRRFGAAKDACEQWTGQRLLDEGHDPEEMGGKEFGDLLHQRRVEYVREENEWGWA